jgi:DNA-binding CsgD family transcriptional regulator
MHALDDAHEQSKSMDRTAGAIADIYHAAAGSQPWSRALNGIARELGLLGCQFVGFSAADGAVLFSHADDEAPSEAELEYIRTYHALDPRLPLLRDRAPGQWLYDEDVFPADIADTNLYYKELLLPYGGRHSASAKLFVQDGEAMLIGFMSRLGDKGFTEERRAFLETIAFHLCHAAAIYHKTRRLSAVSFAGAEVLQRMARPAVLLGTDRSVTFMNEMARQYMAKTGALLLASDCLTAFDKASDRKLAQAFRGIVHDIGNGGVPMRRVMRLAGPRSDFATAISLTTFVPSESMYAFGATAQVLLIVHARASPTAPDMLLWEAAFNLTPSQSRVAFELFLGRSVVEAAQALRMAPSTVKSHLKELFGKTGTNRQSQLLIALASLQAV